MASRRTLPLLLAVAIWGFPGLGVAQSPVAEPSYVTICEDCFGDTFFGQAEPDSACQSYELNVYENWDPSASAPAPAETDIVRVREAFDDDFWYYQIVVRAEHWSGDPTLSGAHMELAFGNCSDPATRYSLVLIYDLDDGELGSTWRPMGDADLELWRDTDGTVGGPTNDGPTPAAANTSDYECGSCTGYDTKLNASGNEAYARLHTTAGPNATIEFALRRNASIFSPLGTPLTPCASRAWTMETSSLGDDDFAWNDLFAVSDLDSSSSSMDNCAGFTAADHVVISDFRAGIEGREVALTWTTGVEAGTAGFEVYREEPDGELVRLAGEAVLPNLPGALGGATYRLIDRDAVPGSARYHLVEVEAGGARHTYGPFEVDSLASRPEPSLAWRAGAEPMELAPGFTAQETPRDLSPRELASRAGVRQTTALEPGDALRISIREPGLYHIAATTIESALGLRSGGAAPLLRSGRLRLTTGGEEVAWELDSRSHPTGLLFYAQGIRSLWTAERIYRLEEARGATMNEVAARPQGTATGLETFLETTRAERDLGPFSGFPIPDGAELWLWDAFRGGHASLGNRTYTIEAPGAAGEGQAQLSVRVQGLSATTTGAHRLEVRLNGTVLGDATFTNFDDEIVTFDFDGALVAPVNQVQLMALQEPGVATSLWALDWFELRYQRTYAGGGPAFTFDGGGHVDLVVGGFPGADLAVYDVTEPLHPRRLSRLEIEPEGDGTYRLRFAPPRPEGRYLALAPEGRSSPAASRPSRHAGLLATTNWADYLVITSGPLRAGAEALAHLRAQQGLVTKVVDIDDVMDEINGGIFHPEALRAFLEHAIHNWLQPPRYVVLAGSGTFDYRDAFGLGTNHIPPLLVYARWGVFPADNRLVDVTGDGIPAMAIGRVPAETPQQLLAYVDKVAAFEAQVTAAWMDEVVLLADRPAATGDYASANADLQGHLSGSAVPHVLEFGPMTRAEVRQGLLALLQDGVSLVSFVGHASPGQLGSQALLALGDVPSLDNAERLPVFSVISCHVGQFALPGIAGLAQRLVLHPDGGAAAVWAPTTLSYHHNRVALGSAFLDAVGDPAVERLGDAVQRALAVPAARETRDTQVLLGDPALLIRITPRP